MKWFYTLRNHVKGPFDNEAFELALQNLGADLKETWVWTRGKAEWTAAERWTIADADKIEAQAHSAAIMQAINPKKAEIKKTPEKIRDAETSAADTSPVSTPPPIQSPPVSRLSPQPAKQKTPAPQQQSKAPLSATEPKPQTKLQSKPALQQPTQALQPLPIDIIMPTDDEITKLLGVSAIEVIESVKQSSNEKYKVQFSGIDQPPMTKEELIKFTAQQEDPSLIMIFEKKSKEWKEIYTFPDIIEKLGLSRRQNRRVTLLANFKGKINQGKEINARLTTISLGGFGLTDVFDLKIADNIEGQISSPHFYAPLSVTAEVTYSGSHGNIGLKFTTISDEGQALVMDYIKKFGQGVKTESV